MLLDPHNEYATAFSEWAEVISPRNMQLPFWLLNFEEIVEVLIGDPQHRKAEIEILQELIPIAKARYSAGRAATTSDARRGMPERRASPSTRPCPIASPTCTGLIDERMGKLENKRDLSPYRQLKTRIETISQRRPLRLHVRLAHGLRRHGAGPRPHLPRAGQQQADHHPRADRPADRDHQRRRVGAVRA